MVFSRSAFPEEYQVKIEPHGKQQLSNKKETSNTHYPAESSGVTNIKSKNIVELITSTFFQVA